MAAKVVEDVTARVSIGYPDDESVPILRCVCGRKYKAWDATLQMDVPKPMPCCGAKLFFLNHVTVHQEKD